MKNWQKIAGVIIYLILGVASRYAFYQIEGIYVCNDLITPENAPLWASKHYFCLIEIMFIIIYLMGIYLFVRLWRKGDKKSTKYEKWNALDLLGDEFSINTLSYDATDLLIELQCFNSDKSVSLKFENILAYRVTLEHYRLNNVYATTNQLYEVEKSGYIGWIMKNGGRQIYGDRLHPRHYVVKTCEHIIDVITTSEIMVIDDGI